MKGTACINDSLFTAIEAFAAAAPTLGRSSLYRADLAELTALYAGAKMELLTRKITKAYDEGHSTSAIDRKSTRLNSSHANISYAVFCLKKKRAPPTALLGGPAH